MASASSPPKSAISSKFAPEVARLLEHQARIEPVTPAIVQAAEHLLSLGLISFERRRYVRCAHTNDRDFSKSNRICTGRCTLNADLDENSRDFRCGECGRTLFPIRHQKAEFEELIPFVIDQGVEAWVETQLKHNVPGADSIQSVRGLWRTNGGLSGRYVCLVDVCNDQKVMSLEWAQQNPTCYVAVHPRAVERFAPVGWLSIVMLTDLLSGNCDLLTIVDQLGNDQCHPVPSLVTPVYSKGAHRSSMITNASNPHISVFAIEVGERTMRVNGIEVVAPQSHAARKVLLQLLKAFWEDLFSGVAPSEFLWQSPDDILAALPQSDTGEVTDVDTVRRTINRLQDNIEDRLRRAGIAAEREDVIQTAPKGDADGYRINPFKVVIRPLIASNREK